MDDVYKKSRLLKEAWQQIESEIEDPTSGLLGKAQNLEGVSEEFKNWVIEAVKGDLVDIAKEHGFDNLRDFFKNLYERNLPPSSSDSMSRGRVFANLLYRALYYGGDQLSDYEKKWAAATKREKEREERKKRDGESKKISGERRRRLYQLLQTNFGDEWEKIKKDKESMAVYGQRMAEPEPPHFTGDDEKDSELVGEWIKGWWKARSGASRGGRLGT